MRAVDFNKYRPKCNLSLDMMSKNSYTCSRVLTRVVCCRMDFQWLSSGEDIELPRILEGGIVTSTKELRPNLVDMEVINS